MVNRSPRIPPLTPCPSPDSNSFVFVPQTIHGRRDELLAVRRSLLDRDPGDPPVRREVRARGRAGGPAVRAAGQRQ